jgi:hypothetical protein
VHDEQHSTRVHEEQHSSMHTIGHVLAAIFERHPETTMSLGPKAAFLGMSVEFTRKGECEVIMNRTCDEIVDSYSVEGVATSLPMDTLFEVHPNKIPSYNTAKQGCFHSYIAKLLYLAKRVETKCLNAVSYLATRANATDTNGIGKLNRLHWYLGYSGGRGIRLWHGERGVCVRVYIDGVYGVHVDGKSNTDSTLIIGDNDLYYVKDGKQRITVKPSTEAEFVKTSDHMNQASHLRSFTIIQGHSDSPVETLQDNMSYMSVLRKSRSTSLGKRHIQFRNSWISEGIDRDEGSATHMKTEMMGTTIILTRILSRRQLPPEGQAPIVQDKGV